MKIKAFARMSAFPAFCLLAACQAGGGEPGVTADDAESFTGIAENETIYFLGNEPFWNGDSQSGALTYATPETPDGTTLQVSRFAGLNGIGLTGVLEDESFVMAVTEGLCSDTMSDRTYPFTVTLKIGEDLRNGCAWTDTKPYVGDELP